MLERLDQRLAQVLHGGAVGQLQGDHREFIAAEAGRESDALHCLLEARGAGHQQGVAELMPGAVIDVLEVVQVQEVHRDDALVLARVFNCRGQALEQQPAIGQLRERVVKSLELQLPGALVDPLLEFVLVALVHLARGIHFRCHRVERRGQCVQFAHATALHHHAALTCGHARRGLEHVAHRLDDAAHGAYADHQRHQQHAGGKPDDQVLQVARLGLGRSHLHIAYLARTERRHRRGHRHRLRHAGQRRRRLGSRNPRCMPVVNPLAHGLYRTAQACHRLGSRCIHRGNGHALAYRRIQVRTHRVHPVLALGPGQLAAHLLQQSLKAALRRRRSSAGPAVE